MKAQQRHQLHTNVLADRLGRFLKDMKSTRRTTSTLVWFLVLVALGALAVWQFAAHATQSQSSALWSDVDEASHDPLGGQTDLANLARNNPGSFAGRTARFQLARLSFQWGQGVFSPVARAEAIKRVQQAQKQYEDLERECVDSPLLAQEAMMGVAKAKEWLIAVSHPDEPEKDLDEAVAAYQKLADQFPDSYLGKAARERADSLKDHSADVVKLYRQLNQTAPAASVEDILKKVPESKSP